MNDLGTTDQLRTDAAEALAPLPSSGLVIDGPYCYSCRRPSWRWTEAHGDEDCPCTTAAIAAADPNEPF